MIDNHEYGVLVLDNYEYGVLVHNKRYNHVILGEKKKQLPLIKWENSL